MNNRAHIISFVALCLALAPSAGVAQPQQPRGIEVTGECLKKVAQDRGAVMLGSSITAQTAKEAAEDTIRSHEKMKRDVLALNLKDFAAETANYVVNQECSYDTGKRRCSGYRATLSTRFETSDIARVGDIIAVASKHGSQEVSELQTFVSTEKLKAERESCLEIATKNATSKAQKLAAGANVRLGKLISLREGGDSDAPGPMIPQRQRAFAMAQESDMASGAPSVDSKPEELQVTVTALYNIE